MDICIFAIFLKKKYSTIALKIIIVKCRFCTFIFQLSIVKHKLKNIIIICDQNMQYISTMQCMYIMYLATRNILCQNLITRILKIMIYIHINELRCSMYNVHVSTQDLCVILIYVFYIYVYIYNIYTHTYIYTYIYI